MSLRTPLAKVRGLGSAKEGTHHFWWQRLTAIALVPLTVWMMIAIFSTTLSDYESARALVAHPVAAVLAVSLIALLFHHGQLGLQVVIEDYIHTEMTKMVLLLLNSFFCAVVGLAAALAALKLAFGG